MKQIVCDLCGHLVEDKEKTANMILTAAGTKFFDLLNPTVSSYDICPKCHKEIITRINNVRKFGSKE